MASKQPPKPKIRPSRKADNLLLIKGIGPAIVNRLHKAGIQTFIQLVSLSPKELAERVPGLSTKLIARENWIGQARKLASSKTYSKTDKKAKQTPSVRQHYENFTIEFLLNENNILRRTRIVHVQSGTVDTWSNWEAVNLTGFLIRHAGIQLPASKSLDQKKNLAQEQPLQAIYKLPGASVISLPDPVSPPSNEVAASHLPMETSTTLVKSSSEADLAGLLQLRDLKIILDGSDVPLLCLHHDQSYHLNLTLDLANVTAPSTIPLLYRANINFTQFGGPCHAACSATGSLFLTDSMTLSIAGTSLTAGTYRLAAHVLLSAYESAPGLTAYLKGDLVQVY